MDDEAEAIRFWQSRFEWWAVELAALPRWAWLRRRRLERHIERTRAGLLVFPEEAIAVACANR